MTPPVRPGRAIRGASAVLLPFTDDGDIDWPAFEAHLQRTITAGLVPAVNMDTGFGPFLDPATRRRIVELAVATGAQVIAGAHVDDEPGSAFDVAAAVRAATEVAECGAQPILFPSHGTAALDDAGIVGWHHAVAGAVDEFVGFELGPMFHPAGRIYSLEVFAELLEIPQMIGLKHSSLRRDLEWERLEVRDRERPEFWLMTGNDLAIDLVTLGCDYLLGLSTFAPDAFARRDAAWRAGDEATFWELNDLLQYLGEFAFRRPVPAYRHDAAMFLRRRGWIDADRTHPRSPPRPDWDRDVLDEIADRLDAALDRAGPAPVASGDGQ